MDLALGWSGSRTQLRGALRGFFGRCTLHVADAIEELCVDPPPDVFVERFETNIPGFPLGLALHRMPGDTDVQTTLLRLSRHLSLLFECEVMCDGSGFGSTPSPHWSVIWRGAEAYLANDLPCDLDPPGPPEIVGSLDSLPIPALDTPYSRQEVERARAAEECPLRGDYCPECSSFIPRFEELGEVAASEIRRMRRTPGEGLESFRRLREITGCSYLWAKIWMMHPDGPHPRKPRPARVEMQEYAATECPKCGQHLGRGSTRCWAKGCDFVLPPGYFARGNDA